jgi:hypothetical protein
MALQRQSIHITHYFKFSRMEGHCVDLKKSSLKEAYVMLFTSP